MLLDCARTPLRVSCRVPWSVWSWVVCPPRFEHRGHRHLRRGLGLALLEDRRHRQDLAGRARLVDLRDGPVAHVVLVGIQVVVRVEGRRGGHGQDPAGLGLEDHDGAALGVGLANAGRDRALRHVLDVAVDGQLHALARLRGAQDVLGRGDGLTGRALLEGPRAVDALEPGVQRHLQPAGADALGVDEAQDVGRQRARRVGALGGLLAEDPHDPQVLDLAPLLGGEPLGDVDEHVGAGELRLQLGLVHPQHRGQPGGGLGRVLDEVLVGGDVARLDGDRQGRTLGVVDRSAVGRQRAACGCAGSGPWWPGRRP